MSTGRRWAIGLGTVGTLVVLALAWLGLNAYRTYLNLAAARDELTAARSALSASDVAQATQLVTSAADHVGAAKHATSTPIWRAASAVPVIGATPTSVHDVANAMHGAMSAIAPAVSSLVALDPALLIDARGRIDLAALSQAAEPLGQAADGVAQARATLADSPALGDSSGVVLPAVREATEQLSEELEGLASTVRNAHVTASVAPTLLGHDGAKRYFVGILNANESRGTGGFLGTYAILRADRGRMTVEEVGSNSDLPSFPQLPIDLGEEYFARYGDDPALIGNMNLSPYFPDAAKLWLHSWKVKTGESLDGVFTADVDALGDLLTATGATVALPDGGSLDGAGLTEFAVRGIYSKFPTVAEQAARKEYQEAVTRQAIEKVTASSNRAGMLSSLARSMGESRVMVWSRDKDVEAMLLPTPVGGSLDVPDGHHVTAVAINSSGSKLDAWLQHEVDYEVGRCASDGMVESRVTMTLTNAIPSGTVVAPYMISNARTGADGPINTVMAQVYVPNGGEVGEVLVDGESVGFSPFTERGRTGVVVDLTLPPREAHSLTVGFFEPDDPGPGTVNEQPLVNPQRTKVTDKGC